MELKYSRFSLQPLKRLNSQKSDLSAREGIYISLNNEYFAEYTPWQSFGDDSVDSILEQLNKGLIPKIIQKQFELDKLAKTTKYSPFKNHNFNKDGVVSKFKISSLKQANEVVKDSTCKFLRLDFNNCLSKTEAMSFWSNLAEEEKNKINYLEDICSDLDTLLKLKSLGAPLACDRNDKTKLDYDYFIYKPNIDIDNLQQDNVIYSSYMSSELGIYHAYIDLINHGDLSLTHGIVTPILYENEKELFYQDNDEYYLNDKAIKEIYEDLKRLEWKDFA